MSSLGFRDFILYATLAIFVIYITRINNMWGVSKGTAKAKDDVHKEKKLQKKRIRLLAFLNKMEWVATNIGSTPSEAQLQDCKYRVTRLRLNSKALGRSIKPMELIGVLRSIQFIGAFIGIIGLILTKSVIFLAFFILILAPSVFNTYADFKINDEDMELEDDFPDFFLLLYSRLTRGAYVRLAPTLESYINSLDVMYQGKSHKVIRNFVVDFRNNIEIYADDSLAVRQLREMYRSAMVINFCNLVVQSLNGVDTKDKLLAFKIELNQKRIEQMKKEAEKRVEKGRRAIFVTYIILFEFVLLSWIAKLGNAGSFLGF